jgi:hypothetical protein
MLAMRPALPCSSLLVGLISLAACGVSNGSGGTTQNTTTGGATATATVDLSDLSKLLMLSHEKGPQDVTYVYTSTVKSPQGTADGSGKAVFTRAPQRFLLDITFPTTPSLDRHQIYDYDRKGLEPAASRRDASRAVRRFQA